MESPSPSKYPDRDGLPLAQLSPQRVNGRIAKVNNITAKAPPLSFSSPIRKKYNDEGIAATFFSPGVGQSPSLPDFSVIRERFLPTTDVSGLVKRFEHLDVRDRDAESQERRRKYDEAIDCAKIGREEAEEETKRCREELRAQRKDLEEFKDNERRACKRIDVLMDEFTRAKEQWSSQSGVYEKEVRRARKEAFKSSSAVLKLQEESKHTANELRGTKTKLDLAQRKAIQGEEEKFAAQYQLVAVQEELEKLQATLRIAQEEREAFKKSLREDDIARIAAEGMIALPSTNEDDETIMDKENANARTHSLQEREVERHLHREQRRRRAAQDLVEFMTLECKFQCCACAVHTRFYAGAMQSRTMQATSIQDDTTLAWQPTQLQHDEIHLDMADSEALHQHDERHTAMADSSNSEAQHQHDQRDIAMVDSSNIDTRLQHDEGGSVMVDNSNSETQAQHNKGDSAIAGSLSSETQLQHDKDDSVMADSTPSVRENNVCRNAESWHANERTAPERETSTINTSVRMVTKTIKVPINFSPVKRQQEVPLRHDDGTKQAEAFQQRPAEVKEYSFDREAALAAIAYRRGRARSFAQIHSTPKRPLSEGVKDRRDVSAPVITG